MKTSQAKGFEILNSLFKDIAEGESVFLENEDLILAVDSSAAIVFSDEEFYSVKPRTSPQSGLLSVLTTIINEAGSIGIRKGPWKRVADIIKTRCKIYPYEAIEEELRKQLIIRGVNKIFNRLKQEDLDFAIEAAAILEVFTGKTISVPEDKIEQTSISLGGNRDNYYNYSVAFKKTLREKGLAFSVSEMTLRNAIESEKREINSATRGFERAILFWRDWPSPVGVSKSLFEKLDDNNRPEKRLSNIPVFLKSENEAPKPTDISLKSETVSVSQFHKTAIFGVLARLYKKTNSNSFWVVKGKVSKEIKERAKEANMVLIDTEMISELTKLDNVDQLKNIKAALWDLPNIELWIRYTAKTQEGKKIVFRRHGPIVHGVFDEPEDGGGVNGIARILHITLPEALWGDERFVLMEVWVYPSLHSLNPNKQKPASRLLEYIMTHNKKKEKNGERIAFISLSTAAELIGYGPMLKNRDKSTPAKMVNEYLGDLKNIGAIESWDIQENGAYKIIIGV